MVLTIHDIPHEILQKIFLDTAEEAGLFDHHHTEDLPQLGREFEDFQHIYRVPPRSNTRRVLLCICRHWRCVAFATPGLWTNISLDTSEHPSLEAIKAFLERSGDLPIEVRLKANAPMDDIAYQPSDESVLSLLRQHLPRIRILVIIMDTYHNGPFRALFPPGHHADLLRLERFYCATIIINSDNNDPPKLGTIRAPKLQSFMVHPDIGFLWRYFIAPSSQNVTRMSISFSYKATDEDLQPIAQCSNIRALNWGAYGLPMPENLVNFHFEHLQSLSLVLMDQAACRAVSEQFHTPRLERFRISGEYTCRLTWIAPYLRRNSQLKELMLHLVKEREDAVDTFTHLTELTILKLFKCTLFEPFIRTFFVQSANGPILPSLKLLDVHPQVDETIHPKWVELAQHRLAHGAKHGAPITILYSNFNARWAEWRKLRLLQEEFNKNFYLTSMRLYRSDVVRLRLPMPNAVPDR